MKTYTPTTTLMKSTLALGACLALTSCYETPRSVPASNQASGVNGNLQAEASPSPGPATSYGAAGVKIAKIIFKSSTEGSFDSASVGGTLSKPGLGAQAVRLFNGDGSALSSGGPSVPTWPRWLTSVELGISGANNASAPGADCARFADPSESTNSQCSINFPDPAKPGAMAATSMPCGGPAGFYRVSEYDCAEIPTAPGTGGPLDGVYVRVQLNREPAAIAPGENLLAILEYTASGLNNAPVQPTDCVKNGQLAAENCSDMTWKVFIKQTSLDVVQPFLLLAPPLLVRNQPEGVVGGSEIQTKQIVIPLATDPALSVIQFSRISGAANAARASSIKALCQGGQSAGNSPLCAGMVLYSLTLMRF
ncbi:hypothetical protein WDW37_19485 [Bdellovibrionota bacterium FG-1]